MKVKILCFYYLIGVLFTIISCTSTHLGLPTDLSFENDKLREAIQEKKNIQLLHVSSFNPDDFDSDLLKEVINYPKIKNSSIYINGEGDYSSILEIPNISGIVLDGKTDCNFPEKLWTLPKLKTLTISFINKPSKDCIHLDKLSMLKKLKALSLNGFPMDSILNDISILKQLEYLSINQSGLKEISNSISQLLRLKTLQLFGTNLTSIPDELSQLPSLEVVQISSKKLKHISELIKNSSKLTELIIKDSQELDSTFFNTQLKELTISYTSIRKIEFGKCPELEVVYLNNNQLSSIPENLTNLPKLTFLNLSDNNIQRLSEDIFTCTHLQQLVLTNNLIDKKDIESLKKALPDTEIIF